MKTRILLVFLLAAQLPLGASAMAQGMGGADNMATRPLAAPELPAGTVSVRVGRGSMSNNAVGVEVAADVVGANGQAQKLKAKTGADGRAIFKDLPAGAVFQAQVMLDGQTLKTAEFPIPEEGGTRLIVVTAPTGEAEAAPDQPAMPPGHDSMMQAMRGADTHALPKERTTDASVLRMGPGSRVILDVREDSLVVMEELVLENTSDKILQPGPSGVRVPVVDGAKDMEVIPGGVPLKADERGVAITGSIPPLSAGMPVRARFGMVVATRNRDQVEIRQPMPMGLPEPLLMVPESTNLSVQGTGVQELPSQTDDSKNVIRIFRLPSVASAGILRFTVTGIPARSHTSETVAGLLFLGMVLAGAIALSRGRKPTAAADTRETLLTELAEWERARRTGGEAPAAKRDELVAALRQSYRQVR